mgnify:CR=1 FL=1
MMDWPCALVEKTSWCRQGGLRPAQRWRRQSIAVFTVWAALVWLPTAQAVPGKKSAAPSVAIAAASPSSVGPGTPKVQISIVRCFPLAAAELGMSEAQILAAVEGLKLDPYGCFGEKHQLMCKRDGVSVVVTTFNGAVKSIRFLAPPSAGFERQDVLASAAALLHLAKRKEVEHDDADRKAGDMEQAVEYFYFDDGARIELTYAKGSRTLVETFLVSAG